MKRTQIILGLILFVATVSGSYLLGRQMAPHDVSNSDISDTTISTSTGEILYWRAPMDPTETYEGPGKSKMGMDLIPVYAEGDPTDVASIPSGAVSITGLVSQQMGVRYGEVHRMDLLRSIRTVGEVKINEERVVQVNARITGWVTKIYVGYDGSAVKKGDPLVELYSPELVATQEEYIRALAYRDALPESSGTSTLEGANRLVNAAKNRLLNWEIDAQFVEHLDHQRVAQQTVTITSPASGVVMEKDVVEGSFISKGKNLYKIADLSDVWVHASFYDYELPWISKGQSVEVELSYLPGKTYRGEVSYIYPILREQARDVHVRIVVPNRNGELKPGMFANVELAGKPLKNVIVVPIEAIIRSGARTLVFVAGDNGSFEPREVEMGGEGGPGNGLAYIISGLESGERVVTSAQFLIDSESRLQEAIQKMRKNRASGASSVPGDMSKMDHSDQSANGMPSNIPADSTSQMPSEHNHD